MNKILEKTLKDSLKENSIVMGSKQVLNSIESSKLVILSKSIPKETCLEIESATKKEKIPLVNFQGTSIALGKLCGVQFRISTISFKSINDADIKSILKESTTGDSE